MVPLAPSLTERPSSPVNPESLNASTPESVGLTPGARSFVADLTRAFRADIESLLNRRTARRQRIAGGRERLDFLAGTAAIRSRDWSVASIPQDLRRRTVEITGPTERKMMINALNSGADV